MKHRNCHLLVGYWSRLRAGREVPDQADIDPRALKRMLPQLFILEAGDCAWPAYRLAGTTLCDRFGRELRGTGFLSHWEREAREPLIRLLRRSLRSSQPVRLSGIGSTARCAIVEMETVLAPLSCGTGAAQRFLGITQFLGDWTQLGGAPITHERLIDCGLVGDTEFAQPIDPPPPAPPPFRRPTAGHRVPYLRLVVSRPSPTLHCDLDADMRGFVDVLDRLRTAATV